jgi:ring-1,2-phenylacetyl-CoA epoxidase subunit PaaD
MRPPLVDNVPAILSQVMDPEIPVMSVLDMGIIREVRWDDGEQALHIEITPTYSGCPAMAVIEGDVTQALLNAGFAKVITHRKYSPPWTTDWMSAEGKEKLRAYGIAPPGLASESLVGIGQKRKNVSCPFCKSEKTELRSEFGATACKAFYFCTACSQPFEFFKPI